MAISIKHVRAVTRYDFAISHGLSQDATAACSEIINSLLNARNDAEKDQSRLIERTSHA